MSKLGNKHIYEITKVMRTKKYKSLTDDGKNSLIADTIIRLTAFEEVNAILAGLTLRCLSSKEIEAALSGASAAPGLDPEQIDALLSKSLKKALSGLTERGCREMAANEAKEAKMIIGLGLAIYERGAAVKAAFEPKPQTRPKARRNSRG